MATFRDKTNQDKSTNLRTTKKMSQKPATHTAPQVDDAQLFRRLCEATFAVTPNTRPEHTLLARQNRCPQGFCKRSGAGNLRTLFLCRFSLQVQWRCLPCASFTEPMLCAQVAARVLSHTTAPTWSKFCLHENDCEDTRDVLCDCVILLATVSLAFAF